MHRSLLGILVFTGVVLGACTMRAPQDVSQAASALGTASREIAIAKPVVLPQSVAIPAPAAVAQTPTASLPAAPLVASADNKEVKPNKEAKPEIKPSKLSRLASITDSLPMLSMMKGENGGFSPINMMMKIRSMMPMCAGNKNCVTTSSGFQRISATEPVVAPLTVATAN